MVSVYRIKGDVTLLMYEDLSFSVAYERCNEIGWKWLDDNGELWSLILQ